MNVRELIEHLEELPDDAEVLIRVSDDEVAGRPNYNQCDGVSLIQPKFPYKHAEVLLS